MAKFFAYDPGNEFEFFDTEDEAKSHALAALENYRSSADEEWSESAWSEFADGVCWGCVMQKANEYILTDPFNTDRQCPDYKLEDVE